MALGILKKAALCGLQNTGTIRLLTEAFTALQLLAPCIPRSGKIFSSFSGVKTCGLRRGTGEQICVGILIDLRQGSAIILHSFCCYCICSVFSSSLGNSLI